MVYVLLDDEDVIGVFDSPDIPDKILEKHFGTFKAINKVDVRDSGVEWTRVIMCNGVITRVTLLEFVINEI
tara:strand:+ start:161 stop:373 length:213 start_codon:yes stop_codon:yes gene_type:complete